jgi:hypothetical protein
MAYEQNFLRLVAIGTISGVEDFTFSMSLINAVTPVPPTPTEVPLALRTAFQLLMGPGGISSNTVALTTLKLNEIGTDGRYVGDETVLYDFDPPIVGSAATIYPPQVALAVSLRTAITRGRAHAGRFYMPAPAVPIGGNGKIQPSTQESLLNTLKTFLDDVNEAMAPWQVGVTSKIGAGAQQRVTHVALGQVFDTIRSRREKFDEAYIEADLAGGA